MIGANNNNELINVLDLFEVKPVFFSPSLCGRVEVDRASALCTVVVGREFLSTKNVCVGYSLYYNSQSQGC